MGKRRAFTQDEINKAIKMHSEKKPYNQIGKELGRSGNVIRRKLIELNIVENKPIKPRNSKSLWSIKELRKYIIDVEKAKKITTGSAKKINVRCPDCSIEKEMIAQMFVRQGLSCLCTNGNSYPERLFTSYLESKGIAYDTQVKFDDSQRRIDFKVIINGKTLYVETHGMAHYKDVNTKSWKDAHKKTVASDMAKRKWCENNNQTLVELDCRESSFSFIRNSIEQSILPNITDDEAQAMTELLELNKLYPVKKIKKLYVEDKLSTWEIQDIVNIDNQTIKNILHRIDVPMRDSGSKRKMIKIVETNQTYKSVLIASKELGLNQGALSRHLSGKGNKSCGKLPNKDKMHWIYVSEDEHYALDQSQQRSIKPLTNIELDTSIFDQNNTGNNKY